MKHDFEKWLEENKAIFYNIYLKPGCNATKTEILDECLKAVKAYENGETIAYVDECDENIGEICRKGMENLDKNLDRLFGEMRKHNER